MRLAPALVLLILLAFAGAAQAATVSGEGGTLRVIAATGETTRSRSPRRLLPRRPAR